MWVGFLYTLVSSLPSGSLVTRVSRKAVLLLFSVSMVKRMDGCCWLRWLRKLSALCCFMTVNVSSTWRFHFLGGFGAVAKVCSSKASMYRSAITAEIGLPIGAPSCCSLSAPLYLKYMDLRTKF